MGEGTSLLASVPRVSVTVIDPCYDCDLAEKFASQPFVTVKKGTSLEILPQLNTVFDCILIDGDHNWYTVYEELKAISRGGLLRSGGIIFFHDVEWPWGRRDMYYRPESIPPQFVQKWDLQGIARGKSESSPDLATLAYLKKASREGGPRNGVLTAIEDFAMENKGLFRFFVVHAGIGLGVMQYRGGFADRAAFILLWVKGMLCNVLIRLFRVVRPLPFDSLSETPSTSHG
jgi:hypothetical protein